MISKKLCFNYKVDENTPLYLGLDERRLKQILLNLLSNALKFTEVGSIELSVSSQLLSMHHCELTIKVSDTGIGIPQHQQDLIFGAFNQCVDQDRARYKGTGLGLAISKRLVELMKGRINVESEVGKGSSFILTLPTVLIMHPPYQEPTLQSSALIKKD